MTDVALVSLRLAAAGQPLHAIGDDVLVPGALVGDGATRRPRARRARRRSPRPRPRVPARARVVRPRGNPRGSLPYRAGPALTGKRRRYPPRCTTDAVRRH